MPKVTYIAHDGEATEVEAKTGDTVMQTAVNNMIEGIVAECGGCLSCATCHVYVDDAWREVVGAPDGNERAILEMAMEPNASSRLSCQIVISDAMDGLIVKMPEAQF